MVVFSNRCLGPAAELLLSPAVAGGMLATTAEAARPLAQGRWELELVRWLEDRSRHGDHDLDISEIAWTPEHFAHQQAFVVEAIARAALGSPHSRALSLWSRMVSDHPRDAVSVGRRWRWSSEPATV